MHLLQSSRKGVPWHCYRFIIGLNEVGINHHGDIDNTKLRCCRLTNFMYARSVKLKCDLYAFLTFDN